MSYSTQWIDNDLIVSYEGELSFKVLFTANTEIYRDKRFREMTFQVVDLRGISTSSLNEEETTSLGNQEVAASMINNHIKIAIVFDNPDYIMSNSQAYIDALADTGWQLQGFDDINKALEWCRSK